MRHLELFAGIGGFRRAMDLLTQDHIMNFHCVGYSEIDPKAVKTYCANYRPEQDEEVAMGILLNLLKSREYRKFARLRSDNRWIPMSNI